MMSDRRAQALAYFISMGWTPEQSAGIVANLEAESGLRPDAVGDGGLAYGIAQWHPDRQANFAPIIGRDIHGSSFEDQLAFVHAELQTHEKAAGDALRACTTAEEAGACVSLKYERPADKEGEADKRAALAAQILASALQTAPDIPTHQPQPETPQKPDLGRIQSPRTPMPALALLSAFAPILQTLIPQIAALFDPAKKVAERNVGIAQVVVDTIVQAAGKANLPEAVGAMTDPTTGPAVTKAVQAAIVTQPDIMAVLEIGGGIAKAREFGVAVQNADKPFWFNPTFWITLLFFPLMYMIAFQVLFTLAGPSMVGTGVDGTPLVAAPWYSVIGFGSDTRTGLINLIVGFVFGGVTGVWFGTSVARQKAENSGTTQIIEDRRQ